MKPIRIFVNVINFALAVLFLLSALILYERIFGAGFGFMRTVLAGSPLILCYFAGFFSEKRDRRTQKLLLIGAPVVTAAAAGLLMPRELIALPFALLCIIPGVLLCAVGKRSFYAFPPAFAIATIIIYLAELAVFTAATLGDEYLRLLGWLAFVTFILSLYSFNARSLRSGVHKTTGGEQPTPAGIRFGNLLLITLFIAAAFAVGMITPLRDVAGVALAYIWQLVLIISNFFTRLNSAAPPGDVPDPAPKPTMEVGLPDVKEGPGGAIFGFAALVISIVVILLMIWTVNRLKKSGKFWDALTSWLRKLFATPKDEAAYTDDVESLLSLRDVLKKTADSVKGLWERVTRRPQTFADMPDDKMRVRFVYKALLNSEQGAETAALYKTPAELGGCLSEAELRRLTADYAELRYGDRDADGDEGQNAAAALRVLKPRRREKKRRR